MPMYFFIFEAKPTSASPSAHDIAGGMANIFVTASSRQEAETRARAHLLEYAWVVKSLDTALEPTPEQIARLDRGAIALHRKALREGLASEFTTWRKKEGKDDDPVELRMMGKSPFQKNNKH